MSTPKRERNLAFVPAEGNKPAHFLTDVTIRGRRVRRFAGYTKPQAQKFLRDLHSAAYEGKLGELLDPKPEGADSFEGYTTAIIESETWKQKRSWKRDGNSFDQLKKYFREKKVEAVADITPAVVQAYINKRKDEDKAAPATVNRETAFLRSILFLAVEDGLIEKNPIQHSRRNARRFQLKENNSREEAVLKHLTRARVLALIDAAEPQLRPILIVAALTGMRKNEILTLKWSHVDLTSGTILVPRETAKSGKERWIPMNSMIAGIMSGLSRTSEYVFTNPATGRPWNNISKAFKRACKAAEIPSGRKTGIVLHDLRHFAAFELVRCTDIVTASRILGHADVKMTMRYVHPSEADKRVALERLGERLFPTRQKDANAAEASPATDSVN